MPPLSGRPMAQVSWAFCALCGWSFRNIARPRRGWHCWKTKAVKRLIYIVPVLAFAVLAYVLFASLIAPAPDTLPSALLNKPVPDIALPALDKM